ncbi:nucleotide exchange factor GrpE [Buchnera aphidicola (Muscaphis stroyani)]|uniref:Protein GrpE n=1 Tax=Buchnera aphidicola (Muscaphis stroyani) TaxID=1241869 RepID=A0A4D6Y4K4_9GAMM|nr:nucleotide exchange factor GrpE [Buchnera aphidicola]QCI24277.1 nucleotide exchange factor GrpE [Buchnera aphidicola (Muscaphis stroyani)]
MNNQKNELKEKMSNNENDIINIKNKKIEELKLRILKNKKKINDIQLRKLAEIENIKKKTETKIKEIKRLKMKEFFENIIPVVDSFEDLLNLSHSLNLQEKPFIEGIKLTSESLLKMMFKFGIKIEGKEKDIFNPQIHDSISTKISNETRPNCIISVYKKGFSFNTEILRKAKVIVSKN